MKKATALVIVIGLATALGCAKTEPEPPAESDAPNETETNVPDNALTSTDDASTNEPEATRSDDEAAPAVAQAPAPDSADSEPFMYINSAEPVAEWAELFKNAFFDGEHYFTGLPTEEGLRRSAESGVTVVVNLLPDDQQTSAVSFDEGALLSQLGMRYERIPMMPNTFSVEDVDRFAAILEAADGKVLVHCASSNRCGGLWATYLNRHRDIELEHAIDLGKAAGLSRDSMIDAVRRVAGEP